MALQKQVQAIPLVQGIDDKMSKILLPDGSLERGVNIEQIPNGEIWKRRGFRQIARVDTLQETTPTRGFARFLTDTSLLTEGNGSNQFEQKVWTIADDRITRKGPPGPFGQTMLYTDSSSFSYRILAKPIQFVKQFELSGFKVNCGHAFTYDGRFFALTSTYEGLDSFSGSMTISIIEFDPETNIQIGQVRQFSGTNSPITGGMTCDVVASGDNCIVGYYPNTSSLRLFNPFVLAQDASLPISSGFSLIAPTDGTNTRLMLVARDNSANDFKVYVGTTFATLVADTPQTIANSIDVSSEALHCKTWTYLGTTYVGFFWHDASGSNLAYQTFSFNYGTDTLTTIASGTISASEFDSVSSVGSVDNDNPFSGSESVVVFMTGVADDNGLVVRFNFNLNGTMPMSPKATLYVNEQTFNQGVVADDGDDAWFFTSKTNTVDGDLYNETASSARSRGVFLKQGQYAHRIAKNLADADVFYERFKSGKVVRTSDRRVYFVYLQNPPNQALLGQIQAPGVYRGVTFGVCALFPQTDQNTVINKQVDLNGTAVYSGGKLLTFDGFNVFPYNFDVKPVISDANLGGGGSSLPAGTYNFAAFFEIVDKNQNVHRSEFSFVITKSTVSTFSEFEIEIESPYELFQYGTEFVCHVFRTKEISGGGGDIFYQIGTIFFGDGSSSSYTITSSLSDTDIDSRTVIYTTGGVLEETNPPNCDTIAYVRNRFWTHEVGNRSTVWFSKVKADNLAPAFSNSLTLNVSEVGGELRGYAALDEKVIIFKERAIFVVVGDGPNNTGVGQFSTPQLISNQIGVKERQSILETPRGVFFLSDKGVFLLTRGLTLEAVGEPVENLIANIRAVSYDEVRDYAVFTMLNSTFIYDMPRGQWYEWTIPDVVDMRMVNDELRLIQSDRDVTQDGRVLEQAQGTWQDDGSTYEQMVKFGQMQFGNYAGYQRIYRVLFTGPAPDDATFDDVDVKVWSNHGTTEDSTFSIPQAVCTENGRFALEVRPARQRCEAMQVQISQTTNFSGFRIATLTAEMGVLPGAGRRASSRRAT